MITPAYAALLALFYVYLCARVIKKRLRYQVAIGDGGEPALARAMRVQGNFADYVPFALLLVWMVETSSIPSIWVHVLCLLLLFGRLLHAFGVSQTKETLIYRQIGMVSTFTVLIASAITLLAQQL